MLTTSIVMMLIPAGVIISLPEAGIVMPLLIGVIGLMGTVDGILSLRNPVGWFFDQYIIAIVGPGKRLAAFSWAEVEKVELGRGVEVTGRGRTVTIPNGNTASDPAVVARVIEFYRTNPRSRPELSDDRFLDRLRTGQL